MYVLSDNLCPSQQLQMILLRFSSFHFQLKYHCLQEAFQDSSVVTITLVSVPLAHSKCHCHNILQFEVVSYPLASSVDWASQGQPESDLFLFWEENGYQMSQLSVGVKWDLESGQT